MSDPGSTTAATPAPPLRDSQYGEHCPFCLSSVPAGGVVCRGCGASKSLRAVRFPIARLFLWCTLFGTIWAIGGIATVAPWMDKDSSYRHSAEQRCVQRVGVELKPTPGMTIPGDSIVLTIAKKPCNEVARLRESVAAAVSAQRQAHPGFVYRVHDSPRTVPVVTRATDEEMHVALALRVGVSMGGLLMLVFGTRIGNRVWRWAFGRATDPMWVR